MNPTRRDFLSTTAAFFLDPQTPADLTLTIGAVEVAIGPKRTIPTTGYNGSFPGPMLRFPGGRAVTVDVINDTASPELVHWHGLFDNQSDDMHPVRLHPHSFELVKVAGKPTRGVIKDVVDVMPRTKVEVDLTADNPGPSLFHCHMQPHMDFGFMAILEYIGQPAHVPMSHGQADRY